MRGCRIRACPDTPAPGAGGLDQVQGRERPAAEALGVGRLLEPHQHPAKPGHKRGDIDLPMNRSVRLEFCDSLPEERARTMDVRLFEVVGAGGRLDEPMVELPLGGGGGPPDVLEVFVALEEQAGVEERRRAPDLVRDSLTVRGPQEPDGDRGPGGLPAKVGGERAIRGRERDMIAIPITVLVEQSCPRQCPAHIAGRQRGGAGERGEGDRVPLSGPPRVRQERVRDAGIFWVRDRVERDR